MITFPLGRAAARRRGLTLVELVVVMAILIAVAGIVIPILPGLIGRAETSARATNTSEIYKWIQTYEAATSHYPSDWDALTDGGGTALSYVNGFTGTAPLQITALTANQSAALNAAGITRVQLMATDGNKTVSPNFATNLTFNPYLDMADKGSATGALPITKTGTPNLVTLTSVGQFQLNLSDNASTSNGVFVVFGLGKRCSLVGSGIAEPPVNFFDNFQLSPDTRYSRYGVVFQVNGTNQNGGTTLIDFNRAKLVRIFRFGSSLGTGDDAIQSYWSDVAGSGGS